MPDSSSDRETRYRELETLLQSADVLRDPKRLARLSREYNELGELISLEHRKNDLTAQLAALESDRASDDAELSAMARDETADLERTLEEVEGHITAAVTPPDPNANKDVIVEIRAGTGGEEAALFAAELFRMYARFAERQGWASTLLSASHTTSGGVREVIFEISGSKVFRALSNESGVHRVQRVPATEKSGRVHTSTATVAVLPVAEERDIAIAPSDVRVDVSTSSGAGGQSVNTTYSAVRLTHLPTGIVVTCQDERSQKQNREKAFTILRTKLMARQHNEANASRSAERRSQIGGALRAEKIRTYNFAQDRVTDHRLKRTWHNLAAILDGDLEQVVGVVSAKPSR